MIGPIYQGFFGNKGSICVELSRYSWIKTKWSPVWTPESELYRHVGLAGEHERILHCSGGDPLSAPLTFKSLNFQTQYPSLSLTQGRQTS